MNITLAKQFPKSETIFVVLTKNKKGSIPVPKTIPDHIKKEINKHLKTKNFEGNKNELLQIFPEKTTQKVFIMALEETISLKNQKRAFACISKKTSSKNSKTIGFFLSKNVNQTAFLEGIILGGYRFKISSEVCKNTIKELAIYAENSWEKTIIERQIKILESVNFVRDLVNAPANIMSPKVLAEKAKELSKGLKNKIQVSVKEKAQLEKLKAGGILGVGQGTHEKDRTPRMVILEYFGGKKSDPTTLLVGKGVCHDSGGYNLKPTGHIEEMHIDMGGAAAVLGVFKFLQTEKPKKNIVAVLGVVENHISGSAYHPGDIITMLNGKTCKVQNTDAEGRLVLADCLHYGIKKYKPAKVFDIATLTGAAISALGYEIIPYMGNDQKLLKKVKNSSEISGEDIWELPMAEQFEESITNAQDCDLNNCPRGVGGGSITAGSFLKQFVGETPWVHFDIGGAADLTSYSNRIMEKGATGAGVRTLIALVCAE